MEYYTMDYDYDQDWQASAKGCQNCGEDCERFEIIDDLVICNACIDDGYIAE